jgi:hypothetical protein
MLTGESPSRMWDVNVSSCHVGFVLTCWRPGPALLVLDSSSWRCYLSTRPSRPAFACQPLSRGRRARSRNSTSPPPGPTAHTSRVRGLPTVHERVSRAVTQFWPSFRLRTPTHMRTPRPRITHRPHLRTTRSRGTTTWRTTMRRKRSSSACPRSGNTHVRLSR